MLILISLAAGGLTLAFHPKAPDYAHGRLSDGAILLARIPVPEDVLWVDARTADEFAAGHIPGALLLSEDDWEAGLLGLLDVWTPDRDIVVYCSSESCHSSQAVATRLRSELGVENVFHLEGGWEAWKEAHP